MTAKITSNSPIIMVDDNEIDYLAAKRYISKSKISNDLIYFESGEEFIDYLKKHSSDTSPLDIALVLMDVNMPGLNGHQTTELIRKLPKYTTKPQIFMLTSSTDLKDKERARISGADGLFEKPFSPEGYIALFNSLI